VNDLATTISVVLDEGGFSGAVRVDACGKTLAVAARGLADRAHGIANTIDTRFPIASGTKGFTGLTVVSLVVDGVFKLDTTARSLLGKDLPAIDDAVTVEQLLSHRSGIGDYLDEDAVASISDYVMPVPVHQLHSAEAYLTVLEGHPQASLPGERFAYNNGGFVVLALLAERAAGQPYAELVRARVTEPAGMADTGFVRSDEQPADVATGYLDADGPRTNVLHLPVLGVGDGGLVSTLSDVHRLWSAFFAGRVVPSEWVELMTRPIGDFPAGDDRYGLGFWLAPTGPTVLLEGYDAGISFRSSHDPVAGVTWTVMSNTSGGAWPVARRVKELADGIEAT
jgi:CubicO group peptidase (beta-lactamase class C family)